MLLKKFIIILWIDQQSWCIIHSISAKRHWLNLSTCRLYETARLSNLLPLYRKAIWKTVLTSSRFHMGNSPARECPSSRCTCYQSNVPQIPNLFALYTRQSEAGTRPRPSARTKWLGEPADIRSPSRVDDSGCVRRARRESRRPTGFPTEEHMRLWFSKNPQIYHLTRVKESIGDTRHYGHLPSRIPRCVIQIIISSSRRYCTVV